MGKYSDFDRVERDWYPTPLRATVPILEFAVILKNLGVKKVTEPCAGDGRLGRNWNLVSKHEPEAFLPFVDTMSDLEPLAEDVSQSNLFQEYRHKDMSRLFMTNPPWENSKKNGAQLNRIIDHLSSLSPTLLLLDGNYMFNLQSQEMMRRCAYVLPIGRVKWIEDSKDSGKENCAWYLFMPDECDTVLLERKELQRKIEEKYR